MPDDAHQALRMRRLLIAAATSMLVPAALLFAHVLGALALDVVLQCTAFILCLILVFYVLFRSGLNLRFGDPSLTAEMIGSSIVLLAWIMYLAPQARAPLCLVYLVSLLFGVLRLETRRLLALAALALIAHLTVIAFTVLRDPLTDLKAAAIELVMLFAVLPWFAFMGGHVNMLRQRLSDSHTQLKEAYDRIERIAVHDELTGLYNRRFLIEVLGREAARVLRSGGAYALCMLDVDHFKSINDGFGHAAGDAVLRHFAEVAAASKRDIDVLGRLGGEEFLLVLPDTDIQGATRFAERLRMAVEESRFPGLPAGRQVTVTAGVVLAGSEEMPTAALERADAALYSGKAAGRNRVVAVG